MTGLIALLLIVTAIVMHRGAILLIVPTVAGMSFVLLGYGLLDAERGGGLWGFYAACTVGVLVGYAFARVPRALDQPPPATFASEEGAWRWRWTVAFAAVLLSLLAYHFAVGGIPLFNQAVETERFNFSSSGLFGIPGRVFLYGMPFLVLYCTAYHRRVGDRRSQLLLRVVWTAYVASQLVSGFKGSIIVIGLMFLQASALAGRPARVSARNIVKYAVAAVASLVFAFAIAFRYSSVGIGDSLDAVRYLADRLTTLPAEPGYYALTELGAHPRGEAYNAEDLRYFANKYFGVGDRTDVFPIDKRVSAALYGTQLDEENFLVPVTIGAPASIAVDAGMIAGVIGSVFFGYLLGATFVRGLRARTPFAAAAWVQASTFTYVFLMNGGLSYSVLNYVSILIFLFAMYLISAGAAHVFVRALGADVTRATNPGVRA
jgi:hypothetical protein